jgi:hypothetical protein
VLARLPERIRTPAVARAVVSPSAILLAGAGTAAAIAGGVPLAAAGLVGLAAWAARVAFAVPRPKPGEAIDPFTVGDPWRRLVQDALQARARFDRTVAAAREGPLRDRLAGVAQRLDDAVQECWRIAKQGHALEGAYRQLDVPEIERELAELRSGSGRDGRGGSEALRRAEAAVEAQLASARRIRAVAHDARDRLRLLNAQLDESVARAVELSVSTGGADAAAPLSDDVDSLVGELEALRQGMEEAGGASRATAT